MKVYPIGYSTPGAQERIEELLKTKAIIIDTRLNPYSWNDAWRHDALKAKYGEKYRFVGGCLGNLNYKGGPIRIYDPDTGIRGCISYLKEGYDLILLCQCKVYIDCHVSEVVRLLLEKMPEVEVVRFEQSSQVQPDTIPCFSTRPPYGTWLANPQNFIRVGIEPKTIENRDNDFTSGYRGPVLIHQSKTFQDDALGFWPSIHERFSEAVSLKKEDYPLGCIVGIADIAKVITEEDPEARDTWFCGYYGIVLANARPIGPIPYRGQLGLFSVPRSVLEQPVQALPEAQTQEPERIIICQRCGPGKGCTRLWTVGDKVTGNIPYAGDVHGVVREVKMEGLTQKVQLKTAVYAPLLSKYIISNDPRWFDGGSLKPRVNVIPELGEHE